MHENRETSETPAGKPDGRSAGKGSGRTARVYVCEESHSGVLPMNHLGSDERRKGAYDEAIFQRALLRSLFRQGHTGPRTRPFASTDSLGSIRSLARYARGMVEGGCAH